MTYIERKVQRRRGADEDGLVGELVGADAMADLADSDNFCHSISAQSAFSGICPMSWRRM